MAASTSPAIRPPTRRDFASDVLALVKELGPTIMRYPGGNFVSGYNWEDGVGPVEERPTRLDLAWFSTETNTFRHQRIHRLVQGGRRSSRCWRSISARAAAMPRATSSNTAIIPAAPTGRTCAARTAGSKPHGVKFWCLGNEMDGPWQMEHKTATEYGRVAARGRQDDALGRPDHRARRLRLVGAQHADLRALGRRGARAHLRSRRLHLAAHLSQQLRGRHRRLPGRARPDGQLHRRGRRHRRCGGGAAPVAASA